jgi:hypothetical protein
MQPTPQIASVKLIPLADVEQAADFMSMRIVKCYDNESLRDNIANNRYEFQHEPEKRHTIKGAVLSLKGSGSQYRIAATVHPTLRQFRDLVIYDPSSPPEEDYEALGMKEAHKQTQQDFQGAKKENLGRFKDYLLESVRGERPAYLPTVSGWQTASAFPDTVFVAFDRIASHALYGWLYLPKKPIMQSDGQTQTAALFRLAGTGAAQKSGALDAFTTTLEIELNCDEAKAGQSFADRNGRGSKKNKNLVAKLDSSSPLARLREEAIRGTVFQSRLADGKGKGPSETNPEPIVDLSTMEQMLLAVTTGGAKKAEQIKHFHVDALSTLCRDFFVMLDQLFAAQWVTPTPKGQEPFRRLYVHGWAFALKAIALAYHKSRIDELGPIDKAIGSMDVHETFADAEKDFKDKWATNKSSAETPAVAWDELKDRLSKIDWLRYRKHWIDITGYKKTKGKKKKRKITDPAGATIEVVEAQAQNTATVIGDVCDKLLSPSWSDLCRSEDAS